MHRGENVLPTRLAQILESPPRAFSPTAIWWWSGQPLDRRRLRRQLEQFADGGVYNLVIMNLAPSGPMFGSDADDPPFFSEAWWELLDGVCDDAEELGSSLWFYDQLGFSGADLQARLVREVPGYAGRWLSPGGQVTTRGFDYLSADACAALLDRVHGEFERRLGHRLGTVIVGSFQDELPSLPTWSEEFAAEFGARRGYDLTPVLPALWKDGPDTDQVRRDFHLTRAELAEEAFFRPLAQWHERHGLLHGCDQQDPARAGHPVDGVRLYADYTRTHRWFGAPGSDHHGDARIHSSLAHLYGRSRTWIEAFHSSGWGGTLEETFDWLLPWLRAGATLYNPHAVYYTTKGGWWEWAPPSTDWRQPYWRHHRIFADAVTRLCAALSLGRHVCDVAVLFPTATAQAGTLLDDVGPQAARAQQVYRELVGDMAWFRMRPGALDRLQLDADVIDDDSVGRAEISGGRLRVADEAYAAILLPACTVLEEATARRLTEFAAAGGLVIAIGALAEHGVGDPGGAADAAVARLRPLCRFVESADDLGPLLNQVVRVEAPVPSLVREVDGATVIFLPAASPGASRISVERPEQRGADLGWLDVTYDFDPGRYASQMRVRVRGVSGRPLVVSPFGGPARPLPYERKGDVTELVVPFDDGPAALLVFADAPVADPHVREPESRPTPTDETDLGHRWEMELIPTLDNTWGDFARPAGELPALSRWAVRHRIERHGEDGLRDGWADADADDGSADDGSGWATAHATFGSHGRWKGPGEQDWRAAVYSASRGIHKDPVHRDTLGPKGHVPEEFLDFGEIGAGQAVLYRAALTVPQSGFLAVGAAAAKTAWVDGVQVALDDWGYLAIATDRLPPGRHVLDLRLVPEEDGWLRAHVAIVGDPERYRRPEWITVGGSAAPGAEIMLTEVISPGAGPTLQVASAVPCRVLVNGVEVGRQGGFDPYTEQAVPRAGRYDVTHALRPGNNELKLALTEGECAPSVLVDGCAVSGRGWRATRDGAEVPVLPDRRQHGDPAALHLRRRPHPLPGTAWLEDDGHDETVLPVVLADPDSEDRVEWLRFVVPPGATAMELAVHGEVTVFVDGQESATAAGTPVRLVVDLDRASDGPPAVRSAALRIRTLPGFTGGAALAGPVAFRVGTGVIELGDWQSVGLAEYSGGVGYLTQVEQQRPFSKAMIDLGAVRGTAEVVVNGCSVGIRVCAPYVFEVTEALATGRNEIEVLVFGTLAPYLDAASPTHFVFSGQRVSGLMGPARLRWSSLA